MRPVEIVEIDDKTRIAVYPDTDAECPREWGDHITRDSPEYKQWAAGEVYGVVIETRALCYDERGNLLTEPPFDIWVQSDSLWGCYLDADYTAEIVAKEYFGVEKKEQA